MHQKTDGSPLWRPIGRGDLAQMALDGFRHPVTQQAEAGEQQQEQQGCAQPVRPAAGLVDLDDQAQEAAQQSAGARRGLGWIGTAVQGQAPDGMRES